MSNKSQSKTSPKSSSTAAKTAFNPSASASLQTVAAAALVAPPPPSKAMYDRYLDEARAQPAANVRKLRAHVSLVTVNGARGVTAVLAHETTIRADLTKVSIDEIHGLAGRAGALAYAHNLTLGFAPAKTVKLQLVRGRAVRRKLLAATTPLVDAGLLPAEAVANIRKGKGPIDSANDLLLLEALYRDHYAAIAGKTTITADDIREAGELGGDLLAQLQTGQVKRTTAKELVDAIDIRDRMWTLYEQAWEQHVWRAGAWLFGRDVDDHVPVLQAHVGHKRQPAPPVAPPSAPSAPTAPTAPAAPTTVAA